MPQFNIAIEQTIHGYDRGHQLLGTSVDLSTKDADRIAQLSDLSGLPVSDSIPDYLTCYPLPSGEFFALARTWPDLNAPRDGCVLTHTILVPAGEWLNGVSARVPLALHRFPGRNILGKLQSLRVDEELQYSSSGDEIADDELFELADGLFGRGALPLVWLSEPSRVESTLANLLDFLWPTARMNFSACTYALQERHIEGKPFNLLVAPPAALSRYSRISPEQLIGYRSSPRLKPNAPRRKLGDRIVPSLRAQESEAWASLNMVRKQLPKELGAIQRVATLDDLRDRSQTSSVSAIALLDIYEQIAPGAEELLNEKGGAMQHAIERVRFDRSDQQLEMLAALYQRCIRPAYKCFRNYKRLIGADITLEVRRSPTTGLRLLAKTIGASYGVIAAIARGLVDADPAKLEGLESFATQVPSGMSSLLRVQPKLAARYLSKWDFIDEDALGNALVSVNDWLDLVREKTRIAICKELVKVAQTARSPELLSKVIEPLNVGALSLVIEVQAPAAIHVHSRRQVELFLRRYPDEVLNHFLEKPCLLDEEIELCAAVVPFNIQTIYRLGALDLSFSERNDRVELLAELMLREDWPVEVRDIAKENASRWLTTLIRYGGESDYTMARAARLLLPLVSPDEIVARLNPADERFSVWKSIKGDLGGTLFSGVSSNYFNQSIDDDGFRHWLGCSTIADWLLSGASITHVVQKNAQCFVNRESLVRLWRWVNEVAFRIRDWSGRAKADLVNEAFKHSDGFWSASVVEEWSSLLERNRRAANKQASALDAQAVQLTLGSRHSQLSAVLATSFPVVYSATVGERDRSLFDVLFMFSDWDKGKDLRRKLVDTYSQPGWPLDEFATIAYKAGILSKVVSRCLRSGRGDLLHRAVFELRSKADGESVTVRSTLEKLLEQGTKEEWD